MSLANLFKIFKKEHLMHYYDGLSETDRKLAWESLLEWQKNPYGNNTHATMIPRIIVARLLKNPWFCPIADKDLIMQMMQPAAGRSVGEYFIMLRLSQNVRPLVWVCAFGGSTRIIRVRIGDDGDGSRYTVILNNKFAYVNVSIQAIMTDLIIHYTTPKNRRIFSWTNLRSKTPAVTTINTSVSSSLQDNNNVVLV